VSRDKPVLVIHHSGRQVVANSRALELAGITRDSIDPPGGSIGRWPGSKEPDGVLDGAAAAALLGALPKLPADDRQAMIQQGQTLYLQNGYTTAVEARATPEDLALYTQAADTGALKLDVMIYADLASAGSALKGHKSVGPKYTRTACASPACRLPSTAWPKTAAPGSPSPTSCRRRASAALCGLPWASDEPPPTSSPAPTPAAGRWPCRPTATRPSTSSSGPARRRQSSRARTAAPAGGRPDPARRPARRPQGGWRGVSFAPQRLALSLAALKDYTLGPERSARFAPAGAPSARPAGAAARRPGAARAVALRRDGRGHQAPAGRRPAARPARRPQGLTLLPARQLGEEKIKGSIAAGKLADFAVLANPLKTPADKLGEIRVTGTVKEGVTVFGGAEGGVPITR
jgi:hypothetical protein